MRLTPSEIFQKPLGRFVELGEVSAEFRFDTGKAMAEVMAEMVTDLAGRTDRVFRRMMGQPAPFDIAPEPQGDGDSRAPWNDGRPVGCMDDPDEGEW